jgi:hypothetical protein
VILSRDELQQKGVMEEGKFPLFKNADNPWFRFSWMIG